MKIQNKNLAGQSLTLRFTRDADDRRVVLTGDAQGVFDLAGCHPKDQQLLSGSAGWRTVKSASKPTEAPAPQAPPAPPSEPEDDEIPDIAGLRSKKDALALAAEYREKGYGIPELDPDTMKLSEMKEALESALFIEED